MSLFNLIKGELATLVADYKLATADRQLSLVEAFGLAKVAIGVAAKVTASLPSSPAERQAAIVAAWDQFVKEYVTPIDLPGPDRLVDPLVEAGAHEAAIQGLVALRKLLVDIGVLK